MSFSTFSHDVNDVMRFEIQHENGKICATRVDYDKPWGLDLARSLAHSEWRLLREVFPKCRISAAFPVLHFRDFSTGLRVFMLGLRAKEVSSCHSFWLRFSALQSCSFLCLQSGCLSVGRFRSRLATPPLPCLTKQRQ